MNEEASLAPTADRAAEVVERLIDAGDVSKVYGEPIRQGDTLLIPTAEILAIAGIGMGGGAGVSDDGRKSRGSGGGGGGRTLARAVAVVVATPEGVTVKPVIDFTKIALAFLTAAGFVWASWRGMKKPKRF
jgi:uncharacterized spore protein YtfJ